MALRERCRAEIEGDGRRPVPRIRERDMRFQRGVHRLLGAEGVLEHLLGVGERLRRIAAPKVKIERNIGVATAGEGLGGSSYYCGWPLLRSFI
jgi:hypothetical protein